MSYCASKPGHQSTMIMLAVTRWKCVSLETYLPESSPLDFHIAQDWIELSGDPVGLVFWKYDNTVCTACFECLQYMRHIICMVAICDDGTGLDLALRSDVDTTGEDMGD
jgi:hypothetical protein